MRPSRPTPRTIRVAFALLFLLGSMPVVVTGVGTAFTDDPASNVPEEVPPSDGITVVTVDGLGPGLIAAYAPNGSRIYLDRRYRFYHDVDPSPAGKATVTYVASTEIGPEHCDATDECSLSVVERVNLTTGERTRLWSRAVPDFGSDNIHDVDRVNETTLLVAEIAHPDGVYMVNTTSGEVIWRWNASQYYSSTAGGSYPKDWTHLNDVEYLPDGRVMASIRNMDSVVFIRPGEGLQEEWTLGRDDDHRTLYEQHNPDYIPEERGGPAVLVADSENDRIVEYQRRNGDWHVSWRWRDGNVQWPRDADRLPNGNTLVTDTHPDRVIEIDERGKIVWQMRVPGPYEAERLGTGSESAGGNSANAENLASRGAGSDTVTQVALAIEDSVPSVLLNGMLFALPHWATPVDAVGMLFAALVGLTWTGVEARWKWRRS